MKNDVILKNCININKGQKKNREEPNFGAGFLGGGSTLQFIDCTSQENIIGFRLADGATVIRGKDIGSIDAFGTTDHHTIVLTDCALDQARQWALYELNSHDVTATNFIVTNPTGNPYPALLVGSSQYPPYNMDIRLSTTATASPTLAARSSTSTISGKAPLTVFFTEQSSSNPTSYAWKFGDGTTSSTCNPTHRYKTAGTYTVPEIIRTSTGENSGVMTDPITVT